VEIVNGARDFRLMKRDVVNSIVSMNEYNRFSKGLFGWVGFKTKWVSYENVERVAGQTKWSFWKLFLYSLDGITAFSTVPLAFASVIGVFFFLIAVISIIFIIIRTSIWGDPVPGWPALVCIILFISSIQLLCLGIIGQYLAKTYLESKKRPVFLLRETNMDSQ
jgi:glycosyltransferase involved in cell wall biosynthesis